MLLELILSFSSALDFLSDELLELFFLLELVNSEDISSSSSEETVLEQAPKRAAQPNATMYFVNLITSLKCFSL